MPRRLILLSALAAVLAAGLAAAQEAPSEAEALQLAKREAEAAALRSRTLERQAAAATGEAARARAASAMLAARIQAAEADITAAETRIRIIERQRAEQRARLAERQVPIVRLTAALQTMARRPPALALVQPGSVDDVVHVRSLLASALPVIRERTAALQAEVARGNALRRQADQAVASLVSGQQELRKQRLALARFEADQRRRSQSLIQTAAVESDRALALGEEARELTDLMGTLEYQAQLRRSLAELPGPSLRPALPGETPQPPVRRTPPYRLPVEGRLLSGMGEISNAGVHERGLTFETSANSAVVAPAKGRIAYAGRFRGHGEVVIIDHGSGWMSAITDLATTRVRVGDMVRMGTEIGRTGTGKPRITVELRIRNVPVPIVPLIAESG